MNPFSFLASVVFGQNTIAKQRGVPVDVGGEPGYAIRNHRFASPIESAWEGITTLPELFESSCRKYSSSRLLGTRKLVAREIETSGDGKSLEKVHLGDYEWMNYWETYDSVCHFSSGLVEVGLGKGDRVAIFADTRPEWFIALQGCFRRNSTVVTIYASLGEDALCHSLNETEVSTVICGPKELKKLVDISAKLDTVKYVIYMDDPAGISTDVSLAKRNIKCTVASFGEVKQFGQKNPVVADMPASSDVAVIMYTSGSTGFPKGVMMTHHNILSTLSAVMTIVPDLGCKDVYLAYLPLAHILELAAESLMAAVGCSIGYGSPLTLTDTSSKIMKGTKGDASILAPTLMTAVPAILDRVRDGVRKKVDATGGMPKRLFDLAYGRRLSAVNGSWFGAWGLEKLLWNFLVFRKVRAALGGRLRFMISGGAPLSGDTQRFINICFGNASQVIFVNSNELYSRAPIGQGYALTETCAGGTFSDHDDTSVGRVGAPLPCVFIKLINWSEGGYLITDRPMSRGEIVIGGPSVTAGYFKNEEKTSEVYKVDERGMRWFYTGDIGQFHPDGCLEIIDRKKDIVKLQHGEYISLGKVEATLMVSPYVDNIMVYADPFHSYCVALVVTSQAALEDWAQKQGITFNGFSDLCKKYDAVKEVQNSIVKVRINPEVINASRRTSFQVAKKLRLDKFEIPSRIILLHEPWTSESGLVTAALKLKREVIRKEFAEDLKKLYT